MDIEKLFVTDVIRNNRAKEAVNNRIGIDHFSTKGANREVYEYVLSYFSQYGTTPSESVVGHKFEDFKFETGEVEFDFLCDELNKKNVQSEVGKALTAIAKPYKSLDPYEAIRQLQYHAARLNAAVRRGMDMCWNHNVEERKAEYEEREKTQGMTGIMTPYDTLNQLTGGIQDEEYWIISAKRFVGKSWELGFWAEFMNHYHRILVVSPEMATKQIFMRDDAITSKVPFDDLRMGHLSPENKEKYFNALDELGQRPEFWVPDLEGGGVSALAAKIDLYNPDIVFVDAAYILPDEKRGRTENERLSNLSKQLAQLKKDKHIPIVAVFQLKRTATDGEESLDDVYYSDQMAQDCDVLLMMFQNDELREQKKMSIKMKKFRNAAGRLWEAYTRWDMDKMDFSEIEEGSDEWTETNNTMDEIYF